MANIVIFNKKPSCR